MFSNLIEMMSVVWLCKTTTSCTPKKIRDRDSWRELGEGKTQDPEVCVRHTAFQSSPQLSYSMFIELKTLQGKKALETKIFQI